MKTSKVNINTLKPHPSNPRIIKDEAFVKLQASLKGFPKMSLVRPIVVNQDNIILAGHQRVAAHKANGVKELEVAIVDYTKDEEAEFMIKDNAQAGDWDLDKLAEHFDLDQLDDWGIQVEYDFEYEEELEAEVAKPKAEPVKGTQYSRQFKVPMDQADEAKYVFGKLTDVKILGILLNNEKHWHDLYLGNAIVTLKK